MAGSILLLWLAAFPLMGSPGPATISLAGVGTGYGFRKGVPYLCGIVVGTSCVLVLIATGVTAIVLAKPVLVNALTILAAIYIVYLAWKIATAPIGATDLSTKQAPDFISGFVLAIANPKAFAAIGAVYSSHTLSEVSLASDSILKMIALTIVIVIVNAAWLAFGSSFSRFLTNPKHGRIANVAFAVLLVTSVAFALLNLL